MARPRKDIERLDSMQSIKQAYYFFSQYMKEKGLKSTYGNDKDGTTVSIFSLQYHLKLCL